MTGDLFYPCVLESVGQHQRSPWFGCACCPSNVARFIPSVPGMVYAHKDGDVYVNLYVGGKGSLKLRNNRITLKQETQYPWQGAVRITIEPEKEDTFAVLLRLPGWTRNEPVPGNLYTYLHKTSDTISLKVNGEAPNVELEKGYARIDRRWKKGDTIELNLPMPVRRVLSHPNVVTNRGKVALERGPIVFCLEGPDNNGQVLDVYIPDDAELKTEFRPDLLNGVMTIKGVAAQPAARSTAA